MTDFIVQATAARPVLGAAVREEPMKKLFCAIALTLFACAPEATDTQRAEVGSSCDDRCIAKGTACGYPHDIVATECAAGCAANPDEIDCVEALACDQLPFAQTLCAPSCEDRCVAKGTACGYPADLVASACAAGCAATPNEIGCVEQLACDQLPFAQQLCATATDCLARCTTKGIGCGYPEDLVDARCEASCNAGMTETQLACVEGLACSALPDADALCAP
jgi:hypothetical protein